MLYIEANRPRGQGGLARNSGSSQEQNRRHRDNADNSFKPFTSMGSQGGVRNRQSKANTECWYCGKKGHRESECWKKCVDLDKYGSNKFGEGNREERKREAKHKANSMKKTTSKSEEVWYIDPKSSNHMISHEERFLYLAKSEQPGIVETGNHTPHPIEHVMEVPLSHVRQKGKFMNVLHVLTITKNLVLVGQIASQGTQIKFTRLECFIEEDGHVIAKVR